jgi:hypothetical protein
MGEAWPTGKHEPKSNPSVRRLRGANLLTHYTGDVHRGIRTEPDEIQTKIIPINPSNRRSFNLYRRAIVLEREAQPQIETRLNCMVALDTHP